MRVLGALILAAVVTATHAGMAQAQTETVTIGGTGSATDIGLWVADKKGFFRDERIEAKFVTFDSAARMIAAAGAGQLDVVAGGHSAGLFNAVRRGIDIRMVADKSQNVTGRSSIKLVMRKALVDTGRYKTYADLKGMKIAEPAPGSVTQPILYKFLQKAGLRYDDVEHVFMAMPSMAVALQNGAIDAALPAEPSVTQALRLGGIVPVANDYDVYPVHEVSEIMYSGAFATTRSDVAHRFMKAFLRGVRYHNDALGPKGEFVGARGDEIVSIATEYGPFKDPAVWRSFILSYCGPDGTLHIPSLREDVDIFAKLGQIEGPIDVDRVIDTSFAEAAVKDLGPYVKRPPSQ